MALCNIPWRYDLRFQLYVLFTEDNSESPDNIPDTDEGKPQEEDADKDAGEDENKDAAQDEDNVSSLLDTRHTNMWGTSSHSRVIKHDSNNSNILPRCFMFAHRFPKPSSRLKITKKHRNHKACHIDLKCHLSCDNTW